MENLGSPEVRIENLQNIIAESSRANAAPTKRGRGRPRKDGNPNAADLKMFGLDSDPLNPSSAPHTSQSDSAGQGSAGSSTNNAGAGATPPPFEFQIPNEMLALALKAPFDIARGATGFEGFKLEDELAMANAPLLKTCIDQYFPQMANSKHAPAFILSGTLLAIAAMQTRDYFEWKRELKRTVKTPRADQDANEAVQGTNQPNYAA